MFELIRSIPGPTFLLIYPIYAIIALIIAKVVLIIIEGTRYRPEGQVTKDPVVLTVLRASSADEPRALLEYFLFKLWKGKYIEISRKDGVAMYSAVEDYKEGLKPIEKYILYRLRKGAANFQSIRGEFSVSRELECLVENAHKVLTELGFVKRAEEVMQDRFISLGGYVLVLWLGLTKLTMGLIYGKPSSFLFLELFFTLLVTIAVLHTSKATKAAEDYMRDIRLSDEFDEIKHTVLTNPSQARDDDYDMLISVLGATYLINVPETVAYGSAISQPVIYNSNNNGNSNSGGCSSCSGGSSCSSCSSCGGGGCGGCGGS